MLLFKRPAEPHGFDKKMKPHRDAVKDFVLAGEKPLFKDAWKGYKIYFSRAQHGKCGYCESYVLATGTGAVEHFRPKAEISELLADGHERPGTSNVEGRKLRTISTQGYWWLAYEWTNWLLACERCNSGWKRTLFPVAEMRTGPPEENAGEKPLLLNPFAEEDPVNHLRFDDLGQVSAVAGSRTGLETIRTLGLTRESLRKPRRKIASRIYDLVDQILLQLAEDREPDPSVTEEILSHGQPEAPYAGMVRIVFDQEVPTMTWSELERRHRQRPRS